MPKAARLSDIGAAHGCFPPTPIVAGSGDVSINGLPAARKGDALVLHACSNCPPHPRSISAGSTTVSINGKPAARASDAIGCGGSISSGSSDTFIGDSGMGGALKSCMEGARESASPFVKVDFEAFPLAEDLKKVMQFSMAAYAGPEALATHLQNEAQALVRAQLNAMQSSALTPALSSLGIDPLKMSIDAVKTAAANGDLHTALVKHLNGTASGVLTTQLAQTVQPQLAQSIVKQAMTAMQSGRVDDAVLDRMLPDTQQPMSLGTHIAKTAKAMKYGNMPTEMAVATLQPALTDISINAAHGAVKEFLGAPVGS